MQKILLIEGEKAPFTGYLMDEEMSIKLRVAEEMLKEYKKMYEDIYGKKPTEKKSKKDIVSKT